MKLNNTILALAAITTGVIAGLFFGYQVSVIPAFKTLSDANYIAAMQAINAAIPQDPFFEFSFLGAAVFLPVAAYLHRRSLRSLRFLLLVAATLLYLIGTLGITIGANVPLNDALAAFSLHSSTPQQAAIARSSFESPWNAWHLIRTIASIGALVLVIVACLSPGLRPMPARRSEKTR
ncbi:DUF1772 domain-containing protein [Ktedonosporobacter rubrisoli]|uniref:DUF1772 domain-containing protein n=1 Tax=Ktedonosporobacter rubrisoli TaxID=2509675 RepID=A0A4P6K3N7_KTERU|nr:anthrone oxygenase family protein [Ktedonosporobacter rubrisoli]QBD82572.1 DUF1772 domain-containing protein [Ktedonosporobacter rubrisoli]